MRDKYTTETTKFGKFWYKNREYHRDDDLPAIEYSNGTKYWYRDGLIHRENGPAVEWYDGSKRYYLEGWWYSEEEYYEYMKEIDDLPIELQLTHEKEWVKERAKRNGR